MQGELKEDDLPVEQKQSQQRSMWLVLLLSPSHCLNLSCVLAPDVQHMAEGGLRAHTGAPVSLAADSRPLSAMWTDLARAH